MTTSIKEDRRMKKLIALLGAAVALFACAKMETEKQQEAPASTPVTFKVNMVDMDATKADAKAAWADGDVIYVTFKGIEAKYLTLTYNSGTSTWAISGDAFSKGDYEALCGDYTLSAVHFPVAVDPAWDGSVLNFTVASKPVYTYYLQQANADYTADLSGADPIVNLTIRVQKAANYVQFFVPGITSSIENWAFAANDVIPAACGGIDTSTGEFADEITKNVGAQFGGFLYADGAVFSAKVTKSGTSQEYTFLLTSTTNIYAFTKPRALTAGTFYRFKATSDALLWTTSKGVESMGTVNLGLSSGLLWGNRLMGAASDTTPGKYYSWGDIAGYELDGENKFSHQFDWEHYCLRSGWSDVHPIFSKYNSTDGKTILEAVDDAATNAYGKGWRMPTLEEYYELVEGCTWTYYENYNETGRNGWLATSKTNSATIFLPMVGNGNYDSFVYGIGNDNRRIYFWSSSLKVSNWELGYHICGKPYANPGFIKPEYDDAHSRGYGFPILPVFDPSL